ncbi:peptide/nickel transport system ATP-binding protein [Palleronia marisminoris]|uniref:Oligopeptide transport ATP-binding protein OppF n=1 Tax=Palleronia marisminoris TaxID=315423 RepID=A0A1Y5S480_9RHOB|nr:ABC transporter ATP-binding protein [Palleronia marisminoris]SFG38588.1 peptide/nickel transport system ATP-binding protein [Palleronia marisminoris]SLN29679.1 Oligopeptide transport ATP-binding protein OppF [Palleronia marisminoris]
MKPLSIRDLSVSFGALRVLHDISFDVRAGECFGLVGESGSGKSTVLSCAAMLWSQWTGRVEIDGVSVQDMSPAERCRTLQMVFQDPYGSLHPRHAIRTVLSEPLKIQGFDNRDARMEQALGDVGLPVDFLDRYPHQLSGGQRQRVAIARALIVEPDVLLLDEPTSALDVSVQAEILNLLAKLRDEKGFTYIMVSHDLAVVDHMCDRFAVMQTGRVVEVLDHDAISSNGATEPYARELIAASLEYERIA